MFQFSTLIAIQRRLGKDNFPLIEQTFYPNQREMVSNNPHNSYSKNVSEIMKWKITVV